MRRGRLPPGGHRSVEVRSGEQLGVPVYDEGTEADPVDIAKHGVDWAREKGRDVLIMDTAGRLHIDERLMDELVRIRAAVKPHNILLVLDAMTGQDAVNVAEQFQERVKFDGVILTKLDGDARGGAALSVRAVTGKPIKFASTGEKLDSLSTSIPTAWRRASSAWATCSPWSRKPSARSTRRRRGSWSNGCARQFTFEDFLEQMQQVRKMGSISGLLGMIPGMPREAEGDAGG